MSTIAENLRTYVVASTSINGVIAGRMHVNAVPETSEMPRIWLGRTAEVVPRDLSGGGGITNTRFDLECFALTPDACIDLADMVRARLDGFFGAMSTSQVKGCFVEDKSDDYIPKGVGSDEGVHLSALGLNLWHT